VTSVLWPDFSKEDLIQALLSYRERERRFGLTSEQLKMGDRDPMHLKRWISGLILAPCLILFILFAPPLLFLMFILGVTLLGLKEYYALALPELLPHKKMLGISLSLLLPIFLYWKDSSGFAAGVTLILILLFVLALSEQRDFLARWTG